MDKQKLKCNLLEKTLKNLIEIEQNFSKGEIKSINLNNKIYKKINLSSYQIENAMNEFSTLEERLNNISLKANTITTKNPYKEMVEKAKIIIAKNRGCNLLDSNELDFINLKYKYGVLAADFAKLTDTLELYEKIIRENELNKEEDNFYQKTNKRNEDNVETIKKILANLISLNTQEGFLKVYNNKGCNEIFFDGDINSKKLCNLAEIQNIDIQLDENKNLVSKRKIIIKADK